MKRLLSLFLAAILLFSLGMTAHAEDVTYTWWIAKGEDTSYYDNYRQNPVVSYLLTKSYAGKQIDIEFWQGISGAEKDNFNNMLATGDLADVIDLTYSDYTPAALLEDGYIIDLTPYVEQYMPNYYRQLQTDPELAEYAYSFVDGEKRILSLCNYSVAESFCGFCYRRDWIVRYGVHPVTGEAFTGGFDAAGEWSDNIVFPNGTDMPLYISDWEWMFEIFTRALEDQGINDGYCISLYYEGAMGSGDLYSGFGGGSPWWYRDENGNAAYGGTSDNMRTFLQCMNTWWNNGWIDKQFAQRSGDMFYSINTSAIHQGKVGLWEGLMSDLDDAMDIGTPYTTGIMVYPAPLPINDVYGSDAQKYHEPDCYYTRPRILEGIAVTTATEKKDIIPLLTFLDSMFEPETADLCTHGFTKAMLDAAPDDAPWKQVYYRLGQYEGTWVESDEEGVDGYYIGTTDGNMREALRVNRLIRGYSALNVLWTPETRSPLVSEAGYAIWQKYDRPAFITSNIESLIPSENNAKKTKIENNQRTFMAQNAPKFIMGQKGYDINNDGDWANFCKMLNKYGVDKVTKMYQEALDMLKR